MDDCFIRYKILSYKIMFNVFSRCFPSIIGGLYSRINIYRIGCFYLRNNYSTRCFQTIIVGLYLRINIYQIGCFYIFYIFMFDFSRFFPSIIGGLYSN